ncbi:helix-turn-helix transcriptional regulator [Saccharospirillum impatiens]|uniref:helix-turn-helix transcriptional regulator n=1 Tax=Saccharospirillum impatiens TaxID=169438 RepID=UPI00048AF9C9|nr:helix-turn-helix transcriptional regulator [Saccharospirillum impatiens]
MLSGWSDFLLEVHHDSARLSAADFQLTTLQRIREHLDFDFAIWGEGDGSSRELHTATVLDQTPDLFETWEPVKHEDPFANLVIGNTGQTWALSEVPRMFHSKAYNEHWGRYHAREMISTMQVDSQTGLHVFVTLARERNQSDFSEAERQFKALVTRHLFLAAHNNDRACVSEAQGHAALIDRFGILHANDDRFTALLVEEWGPGARRRIPAAVIESLAVAGCYTGQSLELTAEPLGTRWMIRARPVNPLPLSPREQQIARQFAAGRSYKQVAQQLGIAPGTVRTHLTRIYEKLGVRDKGALATRLTREN